MEDEKQKCILCLSGINFKKPLNIKTLRKILFRVENLFDKYMCLQIVPDNTPQWYDWLVCKCNEYSSSTICDDEDIDNFFEELYEWAEDEKVLIKKGKK